MRFTNDHWFHEVTSQTQGAEIFRLQTRALGLEEKYALIKDELERSDDFIAQRHDQGLAKQGQEMNKMATRAGWWALALAAVALVIAVLQIGLHDDTATSQFWPALPTKIADLSVWGRTSWRFVAAVILATAAIAASLYGIFRLRSRGTKTAREKATRQQGANNHG